MDAQDAATTHFCKFLSCTNEASSNVGRYSYCSEHRDRAARGLTTDTKPSNGKPTNGKPTSVAARISGLAKEARQVDAARARATKLTEQALAAKRDADALQQAFDEKLRAATA